MSVFPRQALQRLTAPTCHQTGRWVLLAEMDKDHFFLPCRLVPLDGRSQRRQVGPLAGACTFAAWSPDGKWMYFTANPGGVNHIWRQRFPDGQREQITSGPTEEEGIAMASDARSFVTAVALKNSSLWNDDAKGERQISLEGNGTNPKFTPDGKKLCYPIVKEFPNQFAWENPGKLRIADLESGRSDPVVTYLFPRSTWSASSLLEVACLAFAVIRARMVRAQPRCRMSTARLTTSTCLGEPVLPRILGGSHGREQS